MQILDSYQYDYKTFDDNSHIFDHPIDSVSILVMTIHEFIIHKDDPGYLGFNYVQPDHEFAKELKTDLKELLEGRLFCLNNKIT